MILQNLFSLPIAESPNPVLRQMVATGLQLCDNDASFGPGSTCRPADFTVKFSQSILSILPNALFILLGSARLYYLIHKPSRLKYTYDIHGAAKVLFGLLNVGSAAALIHVVGKLDFFPSGTSLAASVMALIAAILLIPLIVMEHHRSLAPSTLVSIYTIAVGLFGSAELRTFGAISLPAAPLAVKAVNVASLFVILVVECIPKRRLLQKQYENYPPSTTTSIFVKPFFPHLVPLLYTGSKRRLTLDDLTRLPPHVLARPARLKLEAALREVDDKSPGYLLKGTIKAFGRRLLSPVLPRFLLVLCTFGQVFLVQDITSLIANPSIPQERGWALVGGFVFIYTGMAFMTFLYGEKTFNISVEYRAALIGTLYEKSLKLTSTAAREVGQGAATSYFSVDAERVVSVMELIHEIWAALLSIILGLVLLWYQASYAMFAPLVLVVILIVGAGFMAKPTRDIQVAWLAAVDTRIKLLTSIFSQLLPIKLGAYEQILHAKVTDLRAKETNALRKFYLSVIVTVTLSTMGQTFASLVTIGFYAILDRSGGGNGPLNVTRIFTIITIVNLLSEPLARVGNALPTVLGGFASLKRLQGFLLLPEKVSDKTLPELSAERKDTESKDPTEVPLAEVEPSFPATVKLNGSFGWDAEKAVLKDLDVTLAAGELTMVIGSVASGKTTLLMTILGETVVLDGKKEVDARRTAIVTQTPFIYPGTLRDNVLLDRKYDRTRLESVIFACGLNQDIDMLPKGELSMLGERGITLSGGQRQRVSLARALYADSDLILLDDTFSALDGETEAHVFKSLFGPEGMLKGKTSILVTHAIQHLERADKVLVLDEGKVTHFGTFTELREFGEAYALAATAGKELETQYVKADVAPPIDEGEDEDEEMLWTNDSTRKGDALKFFFGAVGPIGTFGLLALLVVLAGFTGGLQGFLKHFSTNINDSNIGQWMGGYVAMAAAVVFFNFATFYYFAVVLTQKAARTIHARELTGLLSSPPSFFQKNSAGKILNRFSQDIQAADFLFPVCMLAFTLSIFTLTSTMVFVVIAAPWLGISFVVLFPVFGLVLRFYVSTSKQLQRLHLGSTSPLYTLFSTTIGSLTSVRAFGAGDHFASEAERLLNRSQGPFFYRFAGQLFLRTVLTWLTAILAVGLSIVAVGLRNSTSASFLGVAMSQITGLASSLMGTMITYAEVENSIVSLERIHEFARLPAETSSQAAVFLGQGGEQSVSWPTDGTLEFRDVSVRYRRDLPLALNEVSFKVKGGLKLGICGRTGSGKSSTLLALFRAIDHSLLEGTVLIDGVDTSTVSLHELRDAMSIVTQDPFLWRGSVRDNLDIEGTRSDEEIWDALRSVSMSDTIKELPDQLESLSIVDDESFSKGQRQLLCLARAMLRKRPIVVLDESTSSMDHLTDEKIRQVVKTEMKDTTIIAVAHRISTIVDYDLILVLDEGAVAEFGPPEELLSRQDSRFARLAASQGIFR